MSGRVYDQADWRYRLQPLKLSRDPLCERCARVNRIERASQVHHIVDVSKGGAAYPTLDELESLCHSCHSMITQARKRGGEYYSKGCDARGLPLDPHHPCYRYRK
jgi:5-methylcytosine-specific restriction protein A